MNTQTSYDTIADEYAEKYFHELEHKPFDCQLLDHLIEHVGQLGPICDMGCGPGEVARYLKDHGAPEVLGVDLSPRMIANARRLSPDISFQVGDMLHLDFSDATWGGIAAFYSIIHIPHKQIVEALRELWRVLKPGGLLLLAFHVGDEILHIDEWNGKPVDMDFIFLQPDGVEENLKAAGFEDIETTMREPYPNVEYQSPRAYILAQKSTNP